MTGGSFSYGLFWWDKMKLIKKLTNDNCSVLQAVLQQVSLSTTKPFWNLDWQFKYNLGSNELALLMSIKTSAKLQASVANQG